MLVKNRKSNTFQISLYQPIFNCGISSCVLWNDSSYSTTDATSRGDSFLMEINENQISKEPFCLVVRSEVFRLHSRCFQPP